MGIEMWRDIKGWEGIYQISNHGRLKSFKALVSGRVLSNKNKTGSYLSVILCSKTKQQYTRIHRLVAETFVPNPHQKSEVNHRDGNKQNNHAWNLEWVTHRENLIDDIKRNPSRVSGMRRYNQIIKPRPVEQINSAGEIVDRYPNCAAAGRKSGICSRNIHQVASRTEYKPGKIRKQAGGFKWRFYGN